LGIVLRDTTASEAPAGDEIHTSAIVQPQAYEGLSAMDEATEKLLRELRGSPTDLAKMVARIHQRRRGVVAVSADAIARWNKDDPNAWARVHDWLTKQAIRMIID